MNPLDYLALSYWLLCPCQPYNHPQTGFDNLLCQLAHKVGKVADNQIDFWHHTSLSATPLSNSYHLKHLLLMETQSQI